MYWSRAWGCCFRSPVRFREASFVYWSLYSRGMAATRAQSVPAFEIIESVSPLSILYIRMDVNRELASFPVFVSTLFKHWKTLLTRPLDNVRLCYNGCFRSLWACSSVCVRLVCVCSCVCPARMCVCVFSCVYVRHVYVCFRACMSSTCLCVYGCVCVHARVSGTCVFTCMYILSRQPLQSLNNSPNGTHVTLRHCEASSVPVL